MIHNTVSNDINISVYYHVYIVQHNLQIQIQDCPKLFMTHFENSQKSNYENVVLSFMCKRKNLVNLMQL